MKIAKFRSPSGECGIGRLVGEQWLPIMLPGNPLHPLTALLESEDPVELALAASGQEPAFDHHQITLLPPLDEQEVWAAGVTYTRSRTARMEESQSSASCYDRVYEAPRPELFFKATPHRVAGHGQAVRIRQDSQWSVPEPELTLVLNSRLRLVGFTIGNDMSSRDIEGENPLYLPQAKVYNQCCGLGPWVTLAAGMPPRDEIRIHLDICRQGVTVYKGETDVGHMARSFEELIEWLGRENSFPRGVLLLTGTGIIPPGEFSLQSGDVVSIRIEGIGTLTNPVEQEGDRR